MNHTDTDQQSLNATDAFERFQRRQQEIQDQKKIKEEEGKFAFLESLSSRVTDALTTLHTKVLEVLKLLRTKSFLIIAL
jgi:hypothetical protein